MKCLRLLLLILPILYNSSVFSEVTIEECVHKAQENYPLIKKYDLLGASRDIDLSDINKTWLPRIGVYAQSTVQNVVPSYPEALRNVLNQMGQHVEGLGHLQYKLGVDLSQVIWDGGVSRVKRALVSSQDEVKKASLDVELYSIRDRVESIFFAVLLCEEQIAQNEITKDLLQASLERLRAMLRNGVAMQSDVDMVEAQLLSMQQNIEALRINEDGYRTLLEIFIGERLNGERLKMPEAEIPEGMDSERPEMKLFDSRLKVAGISERLTSTSVMPRIGFFAQAYYGYPGFDYFKSMMSRNLSFNILAGVKITWNIDSFYTLKNNRRKTALETENILIEKEMFIFNTRLKETQETSAINGIKKIMAEDERIVALRRNVRKAAESQLENGVIDATTLLSKISEENIAMLNSKFNQIRLLQDIYKLKYILNR